VALGLVVAVAGPVTVTYQTPARAGSVADKAERAAKLRAIRIFL
jgi:hypothetical protein